MRVGQLKAHRFAIGRAVIEISQHLRCAGRSARRRVDPRLIGRRAQVTDANAELGGEAERAVGEPGDDRI
ncbi:MAG: hypothetical protein JKP95_00405 [Oceanicaulis sp.]|nr:hypothetical protein [Oceanicaulis sp.]